MTKADFIKRLADNIDLSQNKAEEVLNGVIEMISDAMSNGDNITFPGFGTFSVKERAERKGRNPQTGEEMLIKASKNVHFKSGSKLKDAVN